MAEENLKWMPLLKHHTTQIARLNTKMVEAARERQVIRDDLAELKHEVKDLKRGQDKLSRGQDELRHNQNDLRGRTYEQQIQNRAHAIFGRFAF
jgi:FtsZ-binding cell division protein ZapB